MRVASLILCLAAAGAAQTLPDAPAKSTVERVCASCHELGTAVGVRRTKAGWDSIIDAMINRGARASEQDFDAIVAYLAKYFGVVNINKAGAAEIQQTLEIPAEQAEAIVRFRSESGEFKDLPALLKVPGADAKLLEERKDRIVFR